MSLFPSDEPLLLAAERIPRDATPEPYKQLLVHEHHMTVTMESFHRTTVDVEVLDEQMDGTTYCREIVLKKTGTDEVVQFGIVRFDFRYVTQEVQDGILKGEQPLGRILSNYNLLPVIELGPILKLTAGPGLARFLSMNEGETTYGRIATIFCNHRPALDLLEVSAPLQGRFPPAFVSF